MIKRLSGDRDFDLRANDEMDWKKHGRVLDGHWKKMVEDFGNSQAQILDLLCQFDDQLLDETVAQRDYDFRYLINGVIHHDYYHFGQISILR